LMPIFDLHALVRFLREKGYSSRIGSLDHDLNPARRPYLERWLANRDGFVTVQGGNIDFLGIEEVVRMGPFFNIYCVIENEFLAEADDNAHKLLDAGPYFELLGGKVTTLGWSGGVISTILAKDATLSAEFSKSIMKEEVKKITLRAADYCCIVETRAWDPEGVASVFGILDRIAEDVKGLIKAVHLGEEIGT
jgi:hypothetical protein